MGRQKTVGDRRPFGVGGGRMSNIKLKPCPFCGGEVELWAIAGKSRKTISTNIQSGHGQDK